MSLLDVRAAMVADLATAFPAVKTVETHRGRFDSVAEIKRYLLAAPAILVACLGFDKASGQGGFITYRAQWATFLIARDTAGNPRDAYLLALAQSVSAHIENNAWNSSDTDAPGAVTAKNLYAGTIDKLGVGIWSLTWQQSVSVEATDAAMLNPFVTFHQDVDVAPADGQIDITETDTLPQP